MLSMIYQYAGPSQETPVHVKGHMVVFPRCVFFSFLPFLVFFRDAHAIHDVCDITSEYYISRARVRGEDEDGTVEQELG